MILLQSCLNPTQNQSKARTTIQKPIRFVLRTLGTHHFLLSTYFLLQTSEHSSPPAAVPVSAPESLSPVLAPESPGQPKSSESMGGIVKSPVSALLFIFYEKK